MVSGSTVPRRQLGRELRQLRTAGGLKVEEVTEKFRWSRSKLFRIETGQVPINRTDVMAMCQLYKADDELTGALIALADESRNKGWWHSYGDSIPAWFELYVSLEETASRMRQYSAELIPGLLQTEAYTREIVTAGGGDTDVDRLVTVRMERQSLLTRETPPPPQLEVVLNESVIRRIVGSRNLMAGQMQRLLDAIEGMPVTVRILPFHAGAHAGMMGSYLILSSSDEHQPDVVYVETQTGALYLEKPSELARYGALFSDAREKSLGPEQSRDLIATVKKELT